jgi:hypothetical protein
MPVPKDRINEGYFAEELLYLHPDYQDLFGIVSGSVVISTG